MKYLVILSLLMVACCAPCEKVVKEVKTVGGCDKWGECGVGYTDGTFAPQFYPVVGQKVKVCK